MYIFFILLLLLFFCNFYHQHKATGMKIIMSGCQDINS